MTELSDTSVLIVEDNADNMFVLTDLLTAEVDDGGCGIKLCEAAATGRELFQLLEAKPEMKPHLILLDLQIPQEDGYAVLAKLRVMPALQQTRVIAVTANVMPQDVERARKAGFDGFIGKPINPNRFPDQIKRILAGNVLWEPR